MNINVLTCLSFLLGLATYVAILIMLYTIFYYDVYLDTEHTYLNKISLVVLILVWPLLIINKCITQPIVVGYIKLKGVF